MHRLAAEDLRAVLTLGHETAELTQFGQLAPALERMARLVGADSATLTHLDLDSGHEVAVFWPPDRFSADRLSTDRLSTDRLSTDRLSTGRATTSRLDAYAAVGHAHPLRPVLARELPRRAGLRTVPRISDLLSARQWRSHPVRAVMPDVADQMTVTLAGHRPVLHAVTLGRFAGAFADRQRDLLAAAGPLLSAPLGRVSRTGHRALQLSPRPVWVPAGAAPALEPAPAGEPAGDRGRREDRPRPPAGLPLSPRELEVLRLVAEGATDAQVARRLGLASATVSKHLARIYARLGVPNRAAAVRRLGEG